MTMPPEHCTYRVVWSPEDGQYVATVDEMPSLSWLDATPEKAITGMVAQLNRVRIDVAMEDIKHEFGDALRRLGEN